jgi:hypothetical protein
VAVLVRDDVCCTAILIRIAFHVVLIIIVGIIVFGVGTYTSIQSILNDYAAGAVRKWRQNFLYVKLCLRFGFLTQYSPLGYPFTCASSAI